MGLVQMPCRAYATTAPELMSEKGYCSDAVFQTDTSNPLPSSCSGWVVEWASPEFRAWSDIIGSFAPAQSLTQPDEAMPGPKPLRHLQRLLHPGQPSNRVYAWRRLNQGTLSIPLPWREREAEFVQQGWPSEEGPVMSLFDPILRQDADDHQHPGGRAGSFESTRSPMHVHTTCRFTDTQRRYFIL